MRSKTLLFGLIVAVVLVGGCAAPTPTPSPSPTPTPGATSSPDVAEPAAIVAERCTRCHTLARIKSADQDAAAWTATVARMRDKGTRLSDDEAKAIVDFLAAGGADDL